MSFIGTAIGGIGGALLAPTALFGSTAGMGALVGGGLGMMAGSGGDDYANPAADAQAGISNALWNQTGPVRSNLLDMLTKGSEGTYNLAEYPTFQPQMNLINDQYGNARNNILATLPEGGQLYDALANLEGQRADSITGLGSSIGTNLLNMAQQAAFQTPATSIQGLGMAAQSQAQQNAAQSQLFGDIGSSLAWLLG